jgi:hypothetical protein
VHVRIGTEGQEVLLAVTIKPLLSHKRENATSVARLRDTLKIYGAGGWKDTEDLRVGDRTKEGIRRAIFEETGGLVWWGTRAALDSWFINNVEIPAAFERKEIEPYPVVPLFIDLDPSDVADRQAIRTALGRHGEALLDCNGVTTRRGEDAEAFRRRVARRYVRDAVQGLTAQGGMPARVVVAMRALSEPSGEHDLTFDWRGLIDARERTLQLGAVDLIEDALASARDALQATSHSPRVLLDVDLPLPLAYLVGYEWRITTRFRLVVRLRTGSTLRELPGVGEVVRPPDPVRYSLAGGGPVVLAVSCREGFGQATHRYAADVDAQELITLHVPGVLPVPALRGLARACARELQLLSGRGVDKHLLLLGPSGLAVFAGAAANASGPVVIPFWNGKRYIDGLVVGA